MYGPFLHMNSLINGNKEGQKNAAALKQLISLACVLTYMYHCAKSLLYDSVYLCVYLRNAQNITCVVYLKCTTAYI